MSSESLSLKFLKKSLTGSSDKRKFIKNSLNKLNRALEKWKYFQHIQLQPRETQIKLLKDGLKKFSYNDYYKFLIEDKIRPAEEHMSIIKEQIKYLQNMINYI